MEEDQVGGCSSVASFTLFEKRNPVRVHRLALILRDEVSFGMTHREKTLHRL